MCGTTPVETTLDQWPLLRIAATMTRSTVRPMIPKSSVATAVLLTRVVTRVETMMSAAWMASTASVSSAALVGLNASPMSGWKATCTRP